MKVLVLLYASLLLSLSFFPFMTTTVTAQTIIQTTTGDIELKAAVPPGRTMIPPSSTVTQYVDDTGLTINYVPPGWTIIEEDNTSRPEMVALIEGDSATAVVLCPPHSKANLTYSVGCDEPSHGEIVIEYYPAMDKNEDIVRDATYVNPETGLLELNITAQNVLEYDINKFSLPPGMIVQNKTVSVNVTDPHNGTSWQAEGMQVLFASPTSLDLSAVGLYIVDNTTGYSMEVYGPSGDPKKGLSKADIEEISRSGYFKEMLTPDPRGDSIPIHGIGLDNLPPTFDEPIQIMNSISIQRK